MKNITTILILVIGILAIILGSLLFVMRRNNANLNSGMRRELEPTIVDKKNSLQSDKPTPTAVPPQMEGDKYMMAPVSIGGNSGPLSTVAYKLGATIRIPNRSGKAVRLTQQELGLDVQIPDNNFYELKLDRAGQFNFKFDSAVVLRIKVQ